MIRQLQILLVIALTGLSLRFFDARFIDERLINYAVFLSLLGAIAISVPFMLPRNRGFVLPVQMIVFSIFISMPMAYLSWGQGFFHSLVETTPYLLWIFFFYLLYIRLSVPTVERIILGFAILYVVLYFFQLANSDVVLFGKPIWGEEWTQERGVVRIIFPGAGFFFLAVFMSLNKLTTGQKGKLLWITFVLLGILIPFLQATRQFVAGVMLFYTLHFMRDTNMLRKALLVVAFLVGVTFLYVGFADHKIVKGLVEVGERDAGLGSKYIRVLAGSYFITDLSPNFASRILGNGAPYYGVSNYGIFIEFLTERRGYFLSDVGLVAMYAMFGIFSVIGYVIIWVKSVTIPVPKEYQYLKYYLWYLLLTSVTSFSVYHYNYLMATVFVLYIYQNIYERTVELKLPDGSLAKYYMPA